MNDDCPVCPKKVNKAKADDALAKYLAIVKDEDKASDEVYNSRLIICGECDKNNSGTCALCGCFTEFRAIQKTGKCPSKKW